MSRAILLLSGGLDSIASAYLLPKDVEPVLALTADYGQKAAKQEMVAAFRLACHLGITHRTVFLPWLREATKGGALMDPYQEIPTPDAADLDDPAKSSKSAQSVWVPNRNLNLLSMAATWAEAKEIEHVVVGFNAEEAQTFPECAR